MIFEIQASVNKLYRLTILADGEVSNSRRAALDTLLCDTKAVLLAFGVPELCTVASSAALAAMLEDGEG